MAKANITTKKVERTVIEEQEVVTLELTHEEASALHTVTGSVTGSTTASNRKHTSAIWEELTRNGIRSNYRDFSGEIHFQETP